MHDIRSEIEQINEIIAIPAALAEVVTELGKDDVIVQKVTKLIERDPALTTSLLRIANSPFFGIRRKVDTVSSAIILLGIEEVGRMLLTFHLRQRFNHLKFGQQEMLEQLWKHLLATATISRMLSTQYHLQTHGREFTAGLLHDVGKIVFIQYFSNDMTNVQQMITDLELKDWEAETQVYAVSHTEVGGMIAERWQLPSDYVETIRNHHQLSLAGENPVLTAVVRFADILAEHWGIGITEQSAAFEFSEEESWKMFCGICPKAADQNAEKFSEDLRKVFLEQKEFIGMF